MEQNNIKCFELFRQWLEATRPKSASELTSILRSLEPRLTGAHASGRTLGEIHSIYGKLSAAENYSPLELKKVVSEVKTEIGDCFRNISESERRKYNGLNGCTAKQVSNYKTAFIAYVQFLEFAFKMFTLEELENEGYIERKRRNNGKSKPVVFTGSMFRKGLFDLFKKLDLLSSTDGDLITMSLDKLQAVLDAYIGMHNGKVKRDLYGAFSFLSNDPGHEAPGWENVFVANLNAEVDCQRIDLAHISSAAYDGSQNSLRVSGYGEDSHEFSVMPVSVTKPKRRKQTKLSLRILSQLPTREQLPLIGKILHYCEEIQEGTQKFIEILPKGLSTFAEINRDDEVLIAKAISETNTDEVFESARNAYEALAEYARGFRVELVAE